MNDNSTSAPAPSKLVFLSELPQLRPGAKVRFLCCVRDCDETSAYLYVEHRYLYGKTPPPKVAVNYDLLRETVKKDTLQVGSWINVIGYIQKKTAHRQQRAGSEAFVRQVIDVQAILIWSAGAIRISEYEDALEKTKTSETENVLPTRDAAS